MKTILVTGGAGYIGSHVVKELIEKGYKKIIVLDNLSTGNELAVLPPAKVILVDLKDVERMDEIFSTYKPYAVFHFAAHIDATESVASPLKYYENNISNSLNLLSLMVRYDVKKIIFSSSAAVYGENKMVPLTEKAEASPISSYGWSKFMFEKVLADYDKAYGIKSVSLRYFNAAGADVDKKLGKHDKSHKGDLISVLLEVAAGKRGKFIINGVDYETKDGSCVRDLIHVNDLASAHIFALEYLEKGGESEVFNLGSEKGFTVREAVRMTKKITGTDFRVEEGPRREGDIAVSVASSKKAKEMLGWQQKHDSLEKIIETAWGWHNSQSKQTQVVIIGKRKTR